MAWIRQKIIEKHNILSLIVLDGTCEERDNMRIMTIEESIDLFLTMTYHPLNCLCIVNIGAVTIYPRLEKTEKTSISYLGKLPMRNMNIMMTPDLRLDNQFLDRIFKLVKLYSLYDNYPVIFDLCENTDICQYNGPCIITSCEMKAKIRRLFSIKNYILYNDTDREIMIIINHGDSILRLPIPSNKRLYDILKEAFTSSTFKCLDLQFRPMMNDIIFLNKLNEYDFMRMFDYRLCYCPPYTIKCKKQEAMTDDFDIWNYKL